MTTDPPVITGFLRVGPYNIEGQLGKGAMGTVYAARREGDKELIALKCLQFEHFDDAAEAAVERFDIEVKATNSLHHPSIVRVYESGKTTMPNGENYLYYSMPLVPGETLHTALKRGPFFPAEAAAIIIKVADALNFAHGHGIIHRDIKPGNIFITPEGQVVLLDFGICKLAGLAPVSGGTGVMGTLPFMAPEQLLDEHNVDLRADIFAVGSLLYTLLSRRYLRPSSSVAKVLKAVGEGSDLAKIDKLKDVDPAFLEVLRKALQTDPEDRYPRAKELINDLWSLAGEIPRPGAQRVIPPSFTGKVYEVDPAEPSSLDPMVSDPEPPSGGYGEAPPGSAAKPADFKSKWFSKKEPIARELMARRRASHSVIVREVAEPIVVKNSGEKRSADDEWSPRVNTTVSKNAKREGGGRGKAPLILLLVGVLLAGGGYAAYRMLLQKPARLGIASKPTGATVKLDGESVGKTPVEISLPSRLQDHALEVSLAEHVIHKQVVQAPAMGDMEPLLLTLKLQPATLSLTSKPADAVVLVNNQAVCRTPCDFKDFPARKGVQVAVMAKGCAPVRYETIAEPGGAVVRELVLRPFEPFALVLLKVLTDSDKVLLDGQDISAALADGELFVYPGGHVLELGSGDQLRIERLELAPGKARRLDYRAKRQSSPRPKLQPVGSGDSAVPPTAKQRGAVNDYAVQILAAGRSKEARKAFELVLGHAPKDTRALRGLIALAVAKRDREKLAARLDALANTKPAPADIDIIGAARASLDDPARCK